MGFRIKSYFTKKNNILTFLGLFLICAAGFVLRVRNLGALSFWGDDGHTFIGTLSILEHGYPLLPSGNILYHGILGYYFNVIPVLVFGAGEFALRITSVVFSMMSIVALYFLGKVLANQFVGFLSAAVLSFSTWYIIFSREARYYQALQFFFIISFLFFYLGFLKGKKPFRILAAVFMALTPLVHGVGIMLLVLFLPLLLYLGKRFFKKEIMIPFFSLLLFHGLLVLNQIFFWQVGRSFYTEETGIRALVQSYFRLPDPFYIKRIYEMFPEMFAVTVAGAFLFLFFTIGLSARKNISASYFGLEELERRFKRVRIPYHFFLIQAFFWMAIVLVSLGRMYNQQRYIYFLMPLFILVFAYTVYLLSIFILRALDRLYAASNEQRQGIPKRIFAVLLLFFFAVLSIFTVSGIDPVEAVKVADMNHQDPIDVRYSVSNVWERHWDAAAPGKAIAENRQDSDIVITTDIYNTPPYSGSVDYWLWTGDLVSWAPYQKEGDYYFDDTYGLRVLRSFADLYDVLNEHTDQNVWVATSYSLFTKEHIDPVILDFFETRVEELVLRGRDETARLYYFPKTEEALRIPVTAFFEEDEVRAIDLKSADHFLIDLSDPDIAPYLAFGFSKTEPGMGTWSAGDRSFMLLDAQPGAAYVLEITAKPFALPGKVQSLTLFVNSYKVATAHFREAEDFSTAVFEIPPEHIIDGIGYMEFDYAYAASPSELGLSSDIRKLALLFKEISITKK